MSEALPATGAREVLEATFAADPGAVRQAVLRAFLDAGGDWHEAAVALHLEPFVLAEWVRRLDLLGLIQERWPARHDNRRESA